jgi:hypothetical protein
VRIQWNTSFAGVAREWEVDVCLIFSGVVFRERDRKVRASCDGSLPKDGCLVLNIFTVS